MKWVVDAKMRRNRARANEHVSDRLTHRQLLAEKNSVFSRTWKINEAIQVEYEEETMHGDFEERGIMLDSQNHRCEAQ